MSTPVASAGSLILSLIIQVYFACNVILSVLTVIIVSNIMRSVSERNEVGPEGPDINPGNLGRFSNIFINYASLLCLQCNTHEKQNLDYRSCFLDHGTYFQVGRGYFQVSECQPRPVIEYFH